MMCDTVRVAPPKGPKTPRCCSERLQDSWVLFGKAPGLLGVVRKGPKTPRCCSERPQDSWVLFCLKGPKTPRMEEKPATDELTSASIIEERGGVGFEPTTGELVRESWSQKIDFFLSCVGYAVGIGNVWRFPYLCYRNGGGAFLVPYLLMLFICGIPLFFMEMGIGQFTSSSALRVFRISPIFKGVGWTIVFVNWVVISYYDVLLAYAMYYFALSFSWDVPWRSCNNTWNTIHCSEVRRR
ncbi:unnamed protein product [Cyprideis torosa]|uniref:Transporter n=1 Tax=Cyprideis torosa TaxID=163714 RepID=A0A7R8WAP0_9CRUS|nr:unnamed protein product [Cyprideis torosa]CAG0885686.1 unnamed protein product [Cyprideis torosa]